MATLATRQKHYLFVVLSLLALNSGTVIAIKPNDRARIVLPETGPMQLDCNARDVSKCAYKALGQRVSFSYLYLFNLHVIHSLTFSRGTWQFFTGNFSIATRCDIIKERKTSLKIECSS